MRRVRLLRYGFSEGARSLARTLDVKMIRLNLEGNIIDAFSPRIEDIVINWGRPSDPWPASCFTWINEPKAVAIASNKLTAFRKFSDESVNCVPWAEDRSVANEWLSNGKSVCVRALLRASCARGMSIISPGEELPPARLYTQYIKKQHEYRVHATQDGAFDIQRKMRRNGGECDNQIRNLENGWIFGRSSLDLSDVMRERLSLLGASAVRCLGLHYGAVDVLYNLLSDSLYTLEVNTAPGLEGETVNSYSSALRSILQGV